MFLKQDTFAKEMVTLSVFEKDKTRISPYSWSSFSLKNSQLLANFSIPEFDSENIYVCDLCMGLISLL